MQHDTFDERNKSGKAAEAFFEKVVREHGQPGVHTIQSMSDFFAPEIRKEVTAFQDHTGRPNRLRWVPDFILADRREHRVLLVDVKWHHPDHGDTVAVDLDGLNTYRLIEKFFNVAVVIVSTHPETRTLKSIRAHDAWRQRKYPSQVPEAGSGRALVKIPVGDELWKTGIYLNPDWRDACNAE